MSRSRCVIELYAAESFEVGDLVCLATIDNTGERVAVKANLMDKKPDGFVSMRLDKGFVKLDPEHGDIYA